MSYSQILALREESNQAKVELRALYDEAGSNELTVDQKAKEDALHNSITALDERADNLAKLGEAEERAAKAAAEAKVKADEAAAKQTEQRGETANDKLRAIANGEIRSHHFPVEQRDNVTLSAGTATDGAEVVPTDLFGQLIDFMRENATVMLNGRARELRTAGGASLDIPKVTSHSAASIVAENGAIGKDAPQFSSVQLDAYKYAFLVVMSHELMADSGFDILPWVLSQGGEALARGVGAHLIAGSGSGQPNGIFTAATTGVTAASATAITADEIIDLQHSIVSPYRPNASWVMNDSTLKIVRKLKDGDNQYLWRPGLDSGHPDTILGNPVLTDTSCPAATTGLDSVLYGDLRGYVVRFAEGVRVTRSDEFAYDTDGVAWRFIMRADGDLVDTNAVRVLTMG